MAAQPAAGKPAEVVAQPGCKLAAARALSQTALQVEVPFTTVATGTPQAEGFGRNVEVNVVAQPGRKLAAARTLSQAAVHVEAPFTTVSVEPPQAGGPGKNTEVNVVAPPGRKLAATRALSQAAVHVDVPFAVVVVEAPEAQPLKQNVEVKPGRKLAAARALSQAAAHVEAPFAAVYPQAGPNSAVEEARVGCKLRMAGTNVKPIATASTTANRTATTTAAVTCFGAVTRCKLLGRKLAARHTLEQVNVTAPYTTVYVATPPAGAPSAKRVDVVVAAGGKLVAVQMGRHL